MTQANYSLRLQSTLKSEAERVAKQEGTTLNQFINVAVAEKLAALRTADYLRERAARADLAGAEALLDSFGTDEARSTAARMWRVGAWATVKQIPRRNYDERA